jgi:hypothetical protein
MYPKVIYNFTLYLLHSSFIGYQVSERVKRLICKKKKITLPIFLLSISFQSISYNAGIIRRTQ